MAAVENEQTNKYRETYDRYDKISHSN